MIRRLWGIPGRSEIMGLARAEFIGALLTLGS